MNGEYLERERRQSFGENILLSFAVKMYLLKDWLVKIDYP